MWCFANTVIKTDFIVIFNSSFCMFVMCAFCIVCIFGVINDNK